MTSSLAPTVLILYNTPSMKMISNVWSAYQESLLRLIYPAFCGLCQTLLDIDEDGVCSPCQIKVHALKLSPDQAIVINPVSHVSHAWSVYAYDEEVRDLIAAIKFHNRRNLLSVIKEDLLDQIRRIASGAHYDAVVPIPMDPLKMVEREFHFTGLLAKLAARELEIASVDLLTKKFGIPSQNRLNRSERQHNLMGAFKITKPSFSYRHILLIDDVYTTGATTREAASLLSQAGASNVDVLTLARTL